MADTTDPQTKGYAAKIAVLTTALAALAGLIGAATALLTKSESLVCSVGVSFSWCAPRTDVRTTADFEGEWTNKNPRTSGITRVLIEQRLDKLTVHAWGACQPADCDWQTTQAEASGANSGTIKVKWTTSFDVVNAALTIGEGQRLEVRTKTHFTDGSGRPDYEGVEYFQRVAR